VPSRATRLVTAAEAVGVVRDGDVVAVTGVMFNLVPETLCQALEERFVGTGGPTELTEFHLNVFGFGAGTGIDHFAHPRMTRRVIGSSFPAHPWAAESTMSRMILDDAVEAFAIPAGAIAGMFRATASGQPGFLTRAGLGTFVDPRAGGGRLTSRARASGHVISELVDRGGELWLHYRSQPVDVSFILGSRADADGNVSFEDEPLHQAAVAQAMATRASGGTVVVQVREVVPAGALDPRLVKLPSLWTDLVVRADQEAFAYGVHPGDPAFTGAERISSPPIEVPVLSADTIVARRAAMEIAPGDIVNLGAGTPVRELPAVLQGAEPADRVHVSIDHGSLGGTNLGGLLAATHWSPTAFMDSNQVYEYYAGSGLDIAFLGAAEIDGRGNVNVARTASAVPGVGGFVDIVEAARTVVICSALRRGGLRVAIAEGELRVEREGRVPKFVGEVELVCLSAERARAEGKRVLYVTERAVFVLGQNGLTLVEIAPGIALDEVLAAVECSFDVAADCGSMPTGIFTG
jgi:propionate CoA-transferase